MDITTVAGILLAIGMILFGQHLEGGHASSILQATAALIVFGGTIGATMVAFPTKDFVRGLKMIGLAFGNTKHDLPALTTRIVELASVARRDGVLALEGQLPNIDDPFLRRALQFAVDGVDADVTRDSLETAIDAEFQERAVGAKVWETMGGFAPTVGIIGAVLGLIHVMENLSAPATLGQGIAVAFVSTVYGVGAANLVLLPLATKLRQRARAAILTRDLIIEGTGALQRSIAPKLMEQHLSALVQTDDDQRKRVA
jgi:chemotaxis protein MotA